ncbi:VOC family protein [Streptomyces sulphureus]|uniref:VOC family protein n=1 Tax=Streptomyces sulphureus TaxID=47758 RepID=UPI00036121B1|nr:VOC family protein [Streptomyces sulphureus]
MITTDFHDGSPCWLDLGAADPAATIGFYAAVLGWEQRSAGPDSGGYTFCTLEGRIVAAVGPESPGTPPRWTVYFETPDADSTARSVQLAGGTVRGGPMDVGAQGRLVHLTDPLGAEFAAWQPGARAGLEAVDLPGTLCWLELCTSSARDSVEFYRTLFEWDVQRTPMSGDENGRYTLIGTGGAERMHGGIVELSGEQLAAMGGTPYWHPVFAVSDADAAGEAVGASGGQVSMGPLDAPGVGRLAVCRDPWDAEFVLLHPEG